MIKQTAPPLIGHTKVEMPEDFLENVTQPVVSFVIPVYNDEQNIARCLQSILNQNCPSKAIELLVLDNGSTDRTQTIIEGLKIPYRIVPNVHVSGLRNYGATLAKGKFLAFVDSDVELLPQWLTNSLRVFENSEVVASGCFPGIPQASTWVQRTWDLHQRGRTSYQGPTPISWLPSMNLMVRREAFVQVGGFNETLETAEDVDLCYRLGTRGMILCHPEMKAIHWGEAHNIKIFWKKEVWRGLGNLAGVKSHGWRLDEMPSILYPLYTIVCVVGIGVSGFYDLGLGQGKWFIGFCGFLVLPAFLLAGRTAIQSNKVPMIPFLFVLYQIYGLARGYSLLKSLLPKKS